VFIIVLSAFAVLSIVVTVLGARDIKRLLKHLRDQEDQE